MPPKTIRPLLTALHALLITAIFAGSVPPLALHARPSDALSTTPILQDVEPIPVPTSVPTSVPAPVIKIPEATNPVDPNEAPLPIPADEMYNGEPLPDVGRNVEPLGEAATPDLPVAMSVELDRYLLVQGEQTLLRVNLSLPKLHFTSETEVTLTLPPQLQIVGDAETTKVWRYSPETLTERVEHLFSVEVNPAFSAELPVVTEITLVADADGYLPIETRWPVGLAAADGIEASQGQSQTIQTSSGALLHSAGLTLLVPPTAAPVSTQIEYTPLFTPTASNPAETVDETSAVTETQTVTASAVVTPGAEITATTTLTTETILRLPSIFRDGVVLSAPAVTNVAPDSIPAEPAETEIAPTFVISPHIQTVENNGVTFFRLWHLDVDGLVAEGEATAGEAEHPRFETPVLMVIDASDLVEAGVKMGLLGLYTRPDASHPWTLVHNAQYDAERQVWIAWLSHFSDFGQGIKLSGSQERLPSIDGFSSDRNTGAATINVPLDTPAGLGGLNPNLSLNYSTAVVDDIFAEIGHDEDDKRIQANMAGYGWNLGGLTYITKNRDAEKNVYYTLILNGVSYDIYEDNDRPGRYETDPMSFAAITNTLTVTTSVWRIKTVDGMSYEFGGDVPHLTWTSSEFTRSLYVEMRTNLHIDGNDSRELEVVAWYLRHVEDTAGNSMDYTYEVERADALTINSGEGGCQADTYMGQPIDEVDPPYSPNWYNPATRLLSVTWSSNTGKYGDAKAATLRVNFAYVKDRTDYDHGNDPDNPNDNFTLIDGCMPRKTEYRLEEIQVQARQYQSNNWHLLRRYNLDHSYADGPNEEVGENELLRHLLLSKIHEYGADGGLFNTQTFTYTPHVNSEGDTENSIWLEFADNGFGGKTKYEYEVSAADCQTEHSEGCEGSSDLTRHLVTMTRVEDGQDPPTYRVTGYGYSDQPLTLDYQGRLHYVGVDYARTIIYTTTPHFNLTVNYTTSLTEARFEEYEFYQEDPELVEVPDARHGRLQEMRVYDHSDEETNKLFAKSIYTWTSEIWNGEVFTPYTALDDQGHWVFLQEKSEWVDGAGTRTVYEHDPAMQDGTQFGNVTAVEEYGHAHPIRDEPVWLADTVLRRRTETTYFPNAAALTDHDAPYLVSLPARVIVENGIDVCRAENRTIYASDLNGLPSIQNRDGAYDVAPETAYVIKSEQVISGCPFDYTPSLADIREDPNLLVTSLNRDAYGNETVRSSHNGGESSRISIFTTYDSFYALFPVARWNEDDTSLVAEASYYGVNGVAIDGTFGFWGAMSENCEVNNICVRLGYDEFGRKIYQWERQVQGSSWPTAAAAHMVWAYNRPFDADFPEQTTFYVTEWRSPRCAGNFTRKHYDGLGHLVGEQRSHQDYKLISPNCLPGDSPEVTTGHETTIFYEYDALGNQIAATAPQIYLHPHTYYDLEPRWEVRTRTTYDPLNRPVYRFAPNNEQTRTEYFGRFSMVSSPARNGDPIKRLQSQEFGPLGYLRKLHLVKWTGSAWQYEAELNFTHNEVGNLTSVVHPSSLGTSTYSYDQAGRMTGMDDIDLGEWSYVYNRHGQLTDQEDARGVHTCLYYDALARLAGKEYLSGSACPATSSSYDETFVYGGSGTAAANQLTQVSLRDPSSGSQTYTKTLIYTSAGQVMTETVSYPVGGPYSTGYVYDAFGRTEQLVYHDGERVSYGYNGMGLNSAITSSIYSTLVDGVGYDLLGRMHTAHFAESISNTLYLSQTIYPWNENSNNSNARVKAMSIGSSSGLSNTLGLEYSYDAYGNIKRINEKYNGGSLVSNTFSYDLYNRLASSAYNAPIATTHAFTFTAPGQPDIFMGRDYSYDSQPVYAPSQLTRTSDSAQLTFSHDANGNMTQRQFFELPSLARTQALLWDEANRLERITQSGSFTETYWYDENGIRTRKQRTIVPTPTVLNTGYLNPSAQAAETSGSGDNNGYQTNPTNASTDNSTFTVDTDSGSGTSTSCTSNQKDKHRFYNYNMEFPTGVTTIRGIQVRLDALVDNTTGSPKLCVQLSWDGGTTWTSTKTTVNTLTTTEATYTLGSPTDTWGHTWNTGEFSNANFRVRVINIASDTARDFSLDWAAVRVYYEDTPAPATESLYPSAVYEVENGTPTRYYLFNGQGIALRTGSEPVTYLHRDQVGSVVMTTQNGAVVDSRQYFAYGSKRGGDDYPFEPNYTGQRRDNTGLLYYNARYYDPELGMFISPDSMISNPMDYFSYNRYLYGRGNPVSNNDPSGHASEPLARMLEEGGGGSGRSIISVLNHCKGEYACLNYRIGQWLDAHPDYHPASDPYYGQTPDYNNVIQVLLQRAVDSGDLAKAESYFGIHNQEIAPQAVQDAAISGAQITAMAAGGLIAFGPRLLQSMKAAIANGAPILPGMFKYTSMKTIPGYQAHHLWPEALGGPHDGWAIYVQMTPDNFHTAHPYGIQAAIDRQLMEQTGLGINQMRQWARNNPGDVVPKLREIYADMGIYFPY